MRRWLTGLAIAAVVILVAWLVVEALRPPPQIVSVTVPELSAEAKAGEALFNLHCASCHGDNGGGSQKGPPLVHVVYEPSHHADGAFQFAARHGVRAHHWGYGDMPPVEGISEPDIASIIAYVRQLQRANGIE